MRLIPKTLPRREFPGTLPTLTLPSNLVNGSEMARVIYKIRNMSKAAIIWDVDGTLVDTAELHFEAWVKLAAEIGRSFTRADFAATFGRRNPEIIRFLFGERYTDVEVAEI